MTNRPGTYRLAALPAVTLLLLLVAFPLRAGCTEHTTNAESLPCTLPMRYAEVDTDAGSAHPDSLHWQGETIRIRTYRYAEHKRVYLLQSRFAVDGSISGTQLYLYVGSSAYITRIRVNGHFLVQRGTDEPLINEYLFTAGYYLLADDLLAPVGEENLLEVELVSYRNNQGPFPVFRLMTLPQAEGYTHLHNLLNRDIPLVLFALGILTSIFFLSTYFARKAGGRELQYLLFAILALLFGFSYVDYAFTSNLAPSGLFQKISIAALISSLVVSTLFVMEYNRIGKRHRKLWVVLLSILLPLTAGWLIWVACTPVLKVVSVFNEIIAYLVLPVLFVDVCICVVFLWRSRRSNHVIMLVAYLAALIGAAIDGLEIMPGSNLPFTPFSMIFMIFTLFHLFAREFDSIIHELYTKEAVLQQQNVSMEETIRLRTRELQINHDKLLEAVAELEKSNAVKDRFFSIMAHDIKNPLNAMIGFSDLLRESYGELTDDERKEYILQISNGSNGLYKLLENLLEWSRVQTGRTRCRPVLLPFAELVGAVAPLAESRAAAKGVRLKYSYPADACAYADRNMLVTILRNLLDNAIKFSYPDGVVDLLIDATHREYDEYVVADHGAGMPQDMADNLFHIDRVRSTPGTNNEQGTGLGLVLCKEFIDLHKGSIQVRSCEGLGTRIRFRLPKQKPEQES